MLDVGGNQNHKERGVNNIEPPPTDMKRSATLVHWCLDGPHCLMAARGRPCTIVTDAEAFPLRPKNTQADSKPADHSALGPKAPKAPKA